MDPPRDPAPYERPRLPDVAELVRRLRAAEESATPEDAAWAATALVLSENGDGPSLLLIERAHSPTDPWSGDMALPGGRREHGEGLDETAGRETREEVGIDPGTPVARLPDTVGRRSSAVATFAFTVEGCPEPVPEIGEVASALWLPLRVLVDPAARTHRRVAGLLPFPAWSYDRHVVWGLTYQTLCGFLEAAGLRHGA